MKFSASLTLLSKENLALGYSHDYSLVGMNRRRQSLEVWRDLSSHSKLERGCPPTWTLTTKSRIRPFSRPPHCLLSDRMSCPVCTAPSTTKLPQHHIYNDTCCSLLNEGFLSTHNIMASKIIITASQGKVKLNLRWWSFSWKSWPALYLLMGTHWVGGSVPSQSASEKALSQGVAPAKLRGENNPFHLFL